MNYARYTRAENVAGMTQEQKRLALLAEGRMEHNVDADSNEE